MSDGITIERLRVKERLESVEKHMQESAKNREILMVGFDQLTRSVNSIEATLFGEKGEQGLVQRMDAFLKIAEGIKWVLSKIFIAICTAIALGVAPKLFELLSKVLSH